MKPRKHFLFPSWWATGRAICGQLCQAPRYLSLHDAAAPLGGLGAASFYAFPNTKLELKSTEDSGKD